MTRTFLVVLAFASASSLCAQAPDTAAPRSATSSWQIRRDARGAVVSTTVINRRIDLTSELVDGKSLDVLYLEEFREDSRPGDAATRDSVTVTAWADTRGDRTYATELWQFTLPGSTLSRLGPYYDVVSAGCCGTEDAHTYVSLRSGRPIFSSTDPFIELIGHYASKTGSQFRGAVGYLDATSAVGSPALRATPHAEGELVLVSGDSVISRVIISRNSDSVGAHPLGQSVVLAGSYGTQSNQSMLLEDNESVVVRIALSEDQTLVVPIVDWRFSLQAPMWPPFHATLIR